jgi:hypothetical protein
VSETNDLSDLLCAQTSASASNDLKVCHSMYLYDMATNSEEIAAMQDDIDITDNEVSCTSEKIDNPKNDKNRSDSSMCSLHQFSRTKTVYLDSEQASKLVLSGFLLRSSLSGTLDFMKSHNILSDVKTATTICDMSFISVIVIFNVALRFKKRA